MKNLWDDPKRGSVPVAWTVNPNLYFHYYILICIKLVLKIISLLVEILLLVTSIQLNYSNQVCLMQIIYGSKQIVTISINSTLNIQILLSTVIPTFTETNLYRTNEVQQILSDYNPKWSLSRYITQLWQYYWNPA